LVDVWRARPGIPQYDLAQAERIRAVDDAIARLPGLAVIGHALRGVGVSDGIAAATRLVSTPDAET
jgi:oxygen-dependent protoporphyrinogen oxidase